MVHAKNSVQSGCLLRNKHQFTNQHNIFSRQISQGCVTFCILWGNPKYQLNFKVTFFSLKWKCLIKEAIWREQKMDLLNSSVQLQTTWRRQKKLKQSEPRLKFYLYPNSWFVKKNKKYRVSLKKGNSAIFALFLF